MSTWLVITTPTGVYCWDLGDPDESTLEHLVDAARVRAGFPAHDEWAYDGSRYDVQLTFGTPHSDLLDRASKATAADLATVDPADVAAHQTQRRGVARSTRIAAARTMLDQLDPAERAELLRTFNP